MEMIGPAISAGGAHSMFLLEDGTIRECGDGKPLHHVPLIGTVTAISAGLHHSLAIMDGEVWAWGTANRFGQIGNGTRLPQAQPIGLGIEASMISTGWIHSLCKE